MDANILHGWTMSQKPSTDNLEWGKNTSNFDESIIIIVIKDTYLK